MDLAQNDPAELQNQIVEMTKGFVQLNKAGQFEILPDGKRQLREIAKAMDIPYDQLVKMSIGSKELEDKMSKIRFPDAFQDEETQKMIANMAEFNKGTGKYEITYTDPKTGQAITKDVEKVTPEDIEKAQKEANKSMEDVAKEQLTTTQRIAAILEAVGTKMGVTYAGTGFIEKMRQGTVDAYEAGYKPFYESEGKLGTKQLRGEMEKSGGEAFDKLIKGDIEGTLKAMGQFETYLKEGINETAKKVGTNFETLASKSEALSSVFGKIKDAFMKNENLDSKADESKGGTQKLQVKDFIIETYEKDVLLAGGTRLGENTGKETNSKMDVGGTVRLEIVANGDTEMLKRELENNQSLAQLITMKVIQSVNPNVNPNEMNQRLSDMRYDNLG